MADFTPVADVALISGERLAVDAAGLASVTAAHTALLSATGGPKCWVGPGQDKGNANAYSASMMIVLDTIVGIFPYA